MEGRYANLSEAQTNGVDNLLPVDQHRHRLTCSLVFEVMAFVVPEDVVLRWNGVFHLLKLLTERVSARLLLVLYRRKSRLQIDFTRLQSCQCCGRLTDDPINDLV